MADATEPASELERIEAALAAQEALRGVLPEEQVDTMIAALNEKKRNFALPHHLRYPR